MVPIASRPVSGRYRGQQGRFALELRVDIDGQRPTGGVSADYSHASSGRAFGSMRLDEPTVTETPSQIVISGTANFTWSPPQRPVRVTIPRVRPGEHPAHATLRHTAAGGTVYRCAFESPWFRTVELAEGVQHGVRKFESYDTGALASGGAPRSLSYVGAFAEAGIEMRGSGPAATIDTSIAGADAAWSDAELHAAMEQHFARWAGHPQWAVWLMHATRHDNLGLDGPHDGFMQGLMFDRDQRQGCAVFYDVMAGQSAASLRDQLYTCVHELAHGFNLQHSWEPSHGRPPIPSRPAAASWTNYPSAFPGGKAAFWSAFDFQFDDAELAHLRHAIRDDIIMGAKPFVSDAALMSLPEQDGSSPGDGGLRLTLTMPATFAYGVPVTADLTLAVTAPEGRHVQTVLGPRSGTADVAIARAGESPMLFEPLVRHCRGSQTVLVTPDDPPVRDAALLHYGQSGHPFRIPGVYDVQARHTATDGSHVLSDVVRVRVLPPRSAAEAMIGRLTYGEEQTGVLLALMGSDAAQLDRGNDALRQLIARFPGHPAASIARIVRGTNAARAFKSIAPGGRVRVRRSQPVRARTLIDPVVDVDLLDRVARRVPADRGRREALTIALAQVGTRRGIAPAVAAFLRSRIGEFATAVPTVASATARRATDPPPGPGRPPVKVDRDPDERPDPDIDEGHCHTDVRDTTDVKPPRTQGEEPSAA